MNRNESDDNPFATSGTLFASDGVESSHLKIKEVWATVFLETLLLLLAFLAAMALRFKIGSIEQLLAEVLTAIPLARLLTVSGLAGIAVFGGYTTTHRNRSYLPILGIVVFSIFLGVASVFSGLREIAPIPRSLLIMHTLFAVLLVSTARTVRSARRRRQGA